MKRRFVLCLIVPLAGFSAPLCASQIVAGGFTTGQAAPNQPATVTPALQLPLNAVQPFDCSNETAGSFAMTATARVCVCDGKHWTLFNSDNACVWNLGSR